MHRTILLSGFGGQGVMVCGQMLAYTVAEHTNLSVTYFPSYGVEQRGGTANCYVCIADGRIGSPLSDLVDEMVVFNDASVECFLPKLAPGGKLFVDSSVVTREIGRDDVEIVYVPARELAVKAGNAKAENLVMVGAYVGYTGYLGEENVLLSIESHLNGKRADMREVNNEGFRLGAELGKELSRSAGEGGKR